MWRFLLPIIVKASKKRQNFSRGNKVELHKINVEPIIKAKKQECIADPVEVSSKVIRDIDEVFEVDLQIPVVSGMKDISLQNRINSRFESDAINFKNETEVYVNEYVKEAEKNHFPINPCIAKTEYKVHFNKNNILSISVTYYSYTGGAHGSTVIKTTNLNVDKGRILYVRDFFKPSENYEEIILKEIHRQMEEEQDKYYPDATEKLKAIPENQSFYIEDGYIVVYFGQYEIAPYASGIPEFKIPISVMPC